MCLRSECMRTVALAAEPLTADAFGPYGWIPVPDTDPADGEQTLTYTWDDPHLNTIEHTFEEIEAIPPPVDGSLHHLRIRKELHPVPFF